MRVRCDKCTNGYSDMYIKVIYQDNYPPKDPPVQEDRILCLHCFIKEIKEE